MELFFSELLKSIMASGPLAALLFYIFQIERRERLKKDEQKDALTERVFVALEAATTAIRDFTRVLEGTDRK